MSDFTDDTIARYVDQTPEQRKAYTLDPAAHMRVEALRQTLDAVERAMAYEDIPEEARRRVINRVVWGEPEGFVDVRARMRHERELLLTTFDPSEFGFPSDSGSFEALSETMRRAGLPDPPERPTTTEEESG